MRLVNLIKSLRIATPLYCNRTYCDYTPKALRSLKAKSIRDSVQFYVDTYKIRAVAGNGGDGCISFLSAWCKDHAGPDGGDGGNGGHVVFQDKKPHHGMNINGANLSKEMRVMGHGSQHGKNNSKVDPSTDNKKPEDEVNDYLMKAIDARSIDRLRAEHCYPFLLIFRDCDIESKYSFERDHMLKVYFICSLLVYFAITLIQLITFKITLVGVTSMVVSCAMILFSTFFVLSYQCKVTPGMRRASLRIHNNRVLAQIMSFIVITAVALQIQVVMIEGVYNLTRHSAEIDRYHQDKKYCPYDMNEYYMTLTLLAMTTCAVHQILITLAKALLLLLMAAAYIIVTLHTRANYQGSFYDYQNRCGMDWSQLWSNVVVASVAAIALTLHGHQCEGSYRLDFIWKLQANDEKEEMDHLEAYNRKLLANILPEHVAQHFLCNEKNIDELYHEQCESVCVLFATIANFSDFYVELEGNNEGVECLRLLNEIIADFDEILAEENFKYIEKIKSTGATYMAASGLTAATRDTVGFRHVTAMADYALRLRKQLKYVNEHSFNNFHIRICINIGPVVAGVIGARKPQYDIWGNAVNVASRMDSTCVHDHIQVTNDVHDILKSRGYQMRCRGEIEVKGKGTMTTYFLDDLGEETADPSTYEKPAPSNYDDIYNNPQPSTSGVSAKPSTSGAGGSDAAESGASGSGAGSNSTSSSG